MRLRETGALFDSCRPLRRLGNGRTLIEALEGPARMPFLGPAEAQRLASEVYVGWSEERITRLEQSLRVLFCGDHMRNIVDMSAERKAREPSVAFVTCDYDEFKPETYKGFSVQVDGAEVARFSTGDHGGDYRSATDFAERRWKTYESSSVHNFFSDIAKAVADQS